MNLPKISHPRYALAGLLVGIVVALVVAFFITELDNKDLRIDSQGRTIDSQGNEIRVKDSELFERNKQIEERDQRIKDLESQLQAKREARSRLAALLIPAARASGGSCSLDYIRSKESGGNYQATNGQYTGAYQQSTNSWRTYGDGSAPTAGQASPASQDAAAQRQYAAEGSRPWSVCG